MNLSAPTTAFAFIVRTKRSQTMRHAWGASASSGSSKAILPTRISAFELKRSSKAVFRVVSSRSLKIGKKNHRRSATSVPVKFCGSGVASGLPSRSKANDFQYSARSSLISFVLPLVCGNTTVAVMRSRVTGWRRSLCAATTSARTSRLSAGPLPAEAIPGGPFSPFSGVTR